MTPRILGVAPFAFPFSHMKIISYIHFYFYEGLGIILTCFTSSIKLVVPIPSLRGTIYSALGSRGPVHNEAVSSNDLVLSSKISIVEKKYKSRYNFPSKHSEV